MAPEHSYDRPAPHPPPQSSQARAVTELVGSVTRWRRRLDYSLAPLLRGRGLEGLDAPVRVALRMALYEITELQSEWESGRQTRVPEDDLSLQLLAFAGMFDGSDKGQAACMLSGSLKTSPPTSCLEHIANSGVWVHSRSALTACGPPPPLAADASYGVIDSYVQLLKGVVHQGAANLANGVLRWVLLPGGTRVRWRWMTEAPARQPPLASSCPGSAARSFPTAAALFHVAPPATAPALQSLLPPPCRSAVRALEAGELRKPPTPARGMPPQQVAEALAIGASHPTWMVAGWLQQYGPAATLALLKHNNA